MAKKLKESPKRAIFGIMEIYYLLLNPTSMIDLTQNPTLKLTPIPATKILPALKNFLLDTEKVHFGFKSHRDQVVFTNLRLIVINVQGLTGKKANYTSISYGQIQSFSIGNSGSLERDCDLEINTTSFETIRFEIRGEFDIVRFNKMFCGYVL